MAETIQQMTHQLWVEGREMTVTLQKTGATTLRVSWTLPEDREVTDGLVVLLSDKPFSGLDFPEDGTRYTPSTDWAAPADKIDDSMVIVAKYGYFGDDITDQLFVDVTNVLDDTIYYASVHTASSVLQYFPIGVQSYPLESSRFEKSSDTYAGSIDVANVPPSDPENGQVYYDVSTGRVLTWNATVQAWVPASAEPVPTGDRPPVWPNAAFVDTAENHIFIFYNGAWVQGLGSIGNTAPDDVTAVPATLRVKAGATWLPLASGTIVNSSTFPEAPANGTIFFKTENAVSSGHAYGNAYVFTLGQWFQLSNDLLQFYNGTDWTNVQLMNPYFGPVRPTPPKVGDFFYDRTVHDLLIWNGSEWVKADAKEEGTPSTDKIGVGTDGSYDERLRLIRILKGQMGWPSVCVELGEEQFNVAIDNALDEFRRRADNAYEHRYVMFTIKKGQTTYYLNDPRDDSHKIVNVLKVHRISMLGVTALSTEANLYAQAFFQQYFNGAFVDTLALHLMHEASERFEKIFAGNIAFTWHEPSRQLTLHRRTMKDAERVILECALERTEQELLLDRWAKQWIQGWAHAELKEMLGMIRSKYSTLPGPNGGLTLNGDLLIAEARTDFEELLRQINDYEVGNGGVNFGNCAFLIG